MRRRQTEEIQEITRQLKGILDEDTGEKVMLFTDNLQIQLLLEQINRLLEDRQIRKADYIRTRQASQTMLSNISHDMKTPLTVILGYLELLRMEEPDNEMLKKTQEKAQQVADMIGEFFSLARLEAGDMELKMERTDISECCRKVLLDFCGILSEGGFCVEVDIPDRELWTWADEKAAGRILTNLMANAVRYGGDGRFLKVSAEEGEERILIKVTDHGKGIDSQSVSRIFDRLYTVEDSPSRESRGNGLGLAIAKNLALYMGGDLEVKSIPRKETTFTLILKKWKEPDKE